MNLSENTNLRLVFPHGQIKITTNLIIFLMRETATNLNMVTQVN